MSDVLKEICALKKQHVAKNKTQKSEAQLLRETEAKEPVRGFIANLNKKLSNHEFGLIAEIKKASPSKGLIRADFDPEKLAKAYEEGGASCISVLTDWPYFKGNDEYIKEAKISCSLPILRKDFMLDSYQIVESRALGADCILLIMAALSNSQACELYAAAKSLGLDVLVEIHDEAECDRALERLPVEMIGVNNRDLKSLKVSLDVSKRLGPRIPENILRVAESGISKNSDLVELCKSGFSSFLVGESLMLQMDVATATRNLLGN